MEELTRKKALTRTPGGVCLGVFLPNEHANQFTTSSPLLTDSTYSAIRDVARIADEVGLSFALTVARWKGIPGDAVGYATYGLDTFSLAGALLEATEKIAFISTAHTIVWNPVVIAKLGADLDQISQGRWGLNIVAGWSNAEFESLGISLASREQRYDQATDWVNAVRELWIKGESSYSCDFFQLDGAECHPRPLQEGGPLIVNAGSSPTGMAFAVQNADFLFSAGANGNQFKQVREELKSDVGYIGMKRLLIGRTDAEAEEKANEIIAGWDLLAEGRRRAAGGRSEMEAPQSDDEMRGMFPSDPAALRALLLGDVALGSPTTVAKQLAKWAVAASVDGICLALCDFEATLELMAEQCFEPLGNELADAGKTLSLT